MSRTLFRDPKSKTVVKLNPDLMEGLFFSAQTNQSMLALQYAARLIEDLVERVENLEAEVKALNPNKEADASEEEKETEAPVAKKAPARKQVAKPAPDIEA
jgi:hypothetical protein